MPPSPLLLKSDLFAKSGSYALSGFCCSMSFKLHGNACFGVKILVMFFAVLDVPPAVCGG